MSGVCLGLDVGTTGCKVVAMDEAGRVHAEASATYPLYTDKTGAAEQDPHSIWRAVSFALSALTPKLAGHEPVGLALSGAMHSLLPLTAAGEPLGRASTWADSRAADALADLRSACDPQALYAHTGCPVQTPYHPARLRWLRSAEPEVFRSAACFVSLKDWLVYRFCGELCSDVGLASTTGLLELERGRWSDEAVAVAGITKARLPTLAPPTERVGSVRASAARACGLPEGLPVILGSSDGGLANLGSGVRSAGETIITVGTSGAVRQIALKPQLDPEMRTWCYLLGEGHFFAGGAINNGGLTLEWVRRTLYSERPRAEGFKQLLDEAAQVDAQNLLCLPYLTGERSPHWNAQLRGALFGLGDHHTRAHIARAALEGMAFCVADVWQLLRPNDRPVKLTGGVTRAPLWGQLLADTLGAPVQQDGVTDASALGAAALGWLALSPSPVKAFEDAPTPQAMTPQTKAQEDAPEEAHGTRFVPDKAAHRQYRAKRSQFQTLYSAVASYP